METLADRIAWIVAQEVLVLPPGFDRRGMYRLPKDAPAPPRSGDAAPRKPDSRD